MLKGSKRGTKEKILQKEVRKGFGLIAGIVVLIVITMTVGILKIGDASDEIGNTNSFIYELYKAQVAHYKWSQNLTNSLNYGIEFTGSIDPTACNFGKFIYSEEAKEHNGFEEFLERIEPLHNAIHSGAEKAIDALSDSNTDALIIYHQEISPILESLIKELESFIDSKNVEIVVLRKDFTRVLIEVGIICLAGIVLLVFCCVKLEIFIRKEVISNLRRLANESKELAKGKLNIDFTIQCKTNEMLELSNSLNFSVKELSRYIQAIDYCMEEFSNGNLAVECPTSFIGDFEKIEKSISEFSNNISKTLEKVMATSDQVTSGADQISSGAQDLSYGATEQANGVEELSATILDITEKISTTATNVKGINDLVVDTCDMVEAENSKMKEMTDAMTEITEKSNQVKEIIKTMNAITSQTNILSLNAAIEAARAGSSGKGFAVVADEVRNLAQSSNEAAKKIEKLVEDTIVAVEHGSRIAAEAESILENILKRSMEINRKVDEVSIVASEQAEGMEQISIGVDQISSVIQTNSATSEESAAASEELLAQAQLLHELIQQFKLKN